MHKYMNTNTKYVCKKFNTYTGKNTAKETFEKLEDAIKFCNNNRSITGAYQWNLHLKTIKI